MLATEYKNYTFKESETIQEMHTKFTSIKKINCTVLEKLLIQLNKW